MKIFIQLSIISIIFISCKNSNKSSGTEESYSSVNLEEKMQNEAFKKMKALCYSCHSPNAGMDMRIAPPMAGVKMHYLEMYENEEEFVNAIWSFLENPEEDKSLMKGAVRKFGLMPYVPYQEEDIKSIASYIYNNELEKPDWFDQHVKGRHGKMKHKNQGNTTHKKGKKHKNQQRKGPKEQGKAMAMATKRELGKNLMTAIAEKGTPGAVDFCNIKALPITAQKEKELNATIKRASDKPRNLLNTATARENEIISIFKNNLKNGDIPEAIVDKKDGKFDFYYPIVTNDMCLQCHGEIGKQVTEETYKTIKLKYPEDLAIGYGANEVRGIWHITFNKNN